MILKTTTDAKGKVVETLYDKATEKKQNNQTTKTANPVNRTQDQSNKNQAKINTQASTTNHSSNNSSSNNTQNNSKKAD